jgi:hypothetical protein
MAPQFDLCEVIASLSGFGNSLNWFERISRIPSRPRKSIGFAEGLKEGLRNTNEGEH